MMKRYVAKLWLGLALSAILQGRLARAADAPLAAAAAGAPIELPPMMVEESVSTVPWLYANVGGAEFLSRCSAATTRQFIEAWLDRLELMRRVLPEDFLPSTDVPAVVVLYAQDLQQTVSAEIQRELQAGEARTGEAARENRVNIAPNMRLADRDMHASIVYLDEALFDSAALSISPGHVRYLLSSRVPELPAWLVDGVERLWGGADFVLEPITLRPLVWNDSGESDALASDPARPRALLPANELFAGNALRAVENRHPRRVKTRACTQELFVRWAIVSGASTRSALWQLAARAATEPTTEEMFEACFGFDFSELRDRLSDYLPRAVQQTNRIDPGKRPPSPSFEIERATPDQIARVRGEWERLAIGHVQLRLPRVREPYIAQARRTLHRAFDAGDRDPRLLATMGLVEIDAGDETGARQFLESAIARGVVRPRACYELARLRFDELRRSAAEAKRFSFAQLAPIIDPLRRSLEQKPLLPEIFVLLAEAWTHCELSPNAAELAELEKGARFFPRRPSVVLPIVRVLASHGKKSEAVHALDACADAVADERARAEITRLRAELTQATATRTSAVER